MSTFKHHHVRFKEVPDMGSVPDWETELEKIKGIKRVRIDPEKRDVYLEYELTELKEEDIERLMMELGFILDDSFKERLKRGWIHYTEDNELDALQSSGHSCCDVEEIERKRNIRNNEGR